MRNALIIGFLVSLISFVEISAQTLNTSGDWNTGSNWSTGTVPSGTGTDVTLGANPTLNSTANNIIGNVSVNNGVQITVNGNAKLTLGSSALFSASTKKSMTFSNNGTIQINSGSPDGTLEIWGDLIVNNNLQLQVTGNLIVHGNVTMNNNAQIQVSGGGTVTVGGNFGGGNNTQVQVSGTGSTISVTGSFSIGGGSSSIQTSGGGSITAASCSCTGCSGSTGCSGNVTLPVTLISFYGEVAKNAITLKWSTASELNFDFFDVEHSANAKDFTSLGKVTGHGTSNIRNDYSLLDEKPLIGKNYYRLKTVDFDSYTEYFKVIAIDFTGGKVFSISPNPSDGSALGVVMNFIPEGNSTIIIYDNLSNVIGAYIPSNAVQTIEFANALKSGVYYARIISGEFVKVERFVVR